MPHPQSIPITKICEAQADVVGQEALAMIYGLAENEAKWVHYNSYKDAWVKELADKFVNNHAKLETDVNLYYTRNPIVVFRTKTLEYIEEQKVPVDVEGVLYSNGAVLLMHRPDFLLVHLWVDPKTVDLFKYPMPS